MCLEKLKNRIEKMSKHHQIEVLRLLMKFDNINKNSTNSLIYDYHYKLRAQAENSTEKRCAHAQLKKPRGDYLCETSS